MTLADTRRALDDALASLAEMSKDAHNTERFLSQFPGRIATVRRIGDVLAREARRISRAKFEPYWKGVQQDPRFQEVKRIRDLSLKRGEESIRVDWREADFRYDPARARTSVPRVMYPVGYADRAKHFQPVWLIADGPYAGQEVIPVVRQYVEWFRNVVVPTAEALLP
jgi:hypothetical protein